ncbi:MANSC domain-containing protein 1 isoform X2 [Nerophis lumbriciformis]|uniref:MANSC domain-containing protein 1 isoform X2 n=1 Tax=Nerophis lumbriciformis TaxID=546530 RepID=UPI002AE07202|nr:MANSC domain-containing protein 1 isoform X2 [Nerophis lumbriciformis]
MFLLVQKEDCLLCSKTCQNFCGLSTTMTLTLHAPLVRTLGLFVVVVVVLRAEPDTCFSRQHQNAIVNVRLAFNATGTAMDTRVVHSEQDCVLACCSQQVKPGAKCNMAVFNGNKTGGEDNCFLFHCPTEQACPLMAQSGVRTYDIYKGMIHPATIRPVSMTTSTTTALPPPTTTSTTTTTTTTHSSTTPPIPKATATPTFPSAVPTTTLVVKATPTKRPSKMSKKQNKTTRKGKGHAVMVHSTTMPEEVLATTLTPPTTSTELPTTVSATSLAPPTTYLAHPTLRSTTMAATTPPSTTMAPPTSTLAPPTTTTLIMAPPMTRSTTTVAAPTTTSTTSPPITMALTTKAPPTPTPPLPGRTVAPPTTSSTMSAYAGRTSQNVVIVPHIDVQADPTLRNTANTRGKAPTAAQGALRIGVVAFLVLAIAVVSLALAVGGRKAMESFDRRHYTRLELNDLHYDV